MSRGTPVGKVSGVECPECGSIKTRTRATGYSYDDDRVRRRQCADCLHYFLTIEVAVPPGVAWGELVPYSRARDRDANYERFGWRPRLEWRKPVVELDVSVSVRRKAA